VRENKLSIRHKNKNRFSVEFCSSLEMERFAVEKFSGNFNLESSIVSTMRALNDSFYICNLSDIIRKYEEWKEFLPRVKPFYAVKCNDDINVLKTLASLGCSFDCASLWEIEKILALQVDPQRIIFANTTKIASHVEFAKRECSGKIRFLTFDNEDEIHKIFKIYPDAK
jgi:diaminopimelate decarboxylase